MTSRRVFKQKIIAIVYDFDGTLTPRPMQEYTVLPQLGVSADDFWREVRETARREGADEMLSYMRLLCDRVANGSHIGRSDFASLAKKIEYFPGVEDWFDRVDKYARKHTLGRNVQIRHYIISAGLKEILDGISIRRKFHRIYASEYHFNSHDVPTFPNVVITDTVKTQFLFRINKGREDLHESINDHMDESDRPIPFSNMIYLGDGLSDVPCMTVCKHNGGHSIAVYAAGRRKAKETCHRLLESGRVDFITPADYREGKELDRCVRVLLDRILANIRFQHARHAQNMKLHPPSATQFNRIDSSPPACELATGGNLMNSVPLESLLAKENGEESVVEKAAIADNISRHCDCGEVAAPACRKELGNKE